MVRNLHRGPHGRPTMQSGMFDEMRGTMQSASIRAAYSDLSRWLDETPREILDARRSQAELFFRRIGITFAVYGDNETTERLIPFDIIPRVITKAEWSGLERGLRQRVTALNAFLADIYRGHRYRAGRREHLLCSRGQRAHSFRGLVHAREPGSDDAAVSGAVCSSSSRARR